MNEDKYQHGEVGFEHPAKGMRDQCSKCFFWLGNRGGDNCRIVQPKVQAGDWCRKFSRKNFQLDRNR